MINNLNSRIIVEGEDAKKIAFMVNKLLSPEGLSLLELNSLVAALSAYRTILSETNFNSNE